MFAGYHYTLNPKKPGYDGLWGTHPEFGLMRGTENIIGTVRSRRPTSVPSLQYDSCPSHEVVESLRVSGDTAMPRAGRRRELAGPVQRAARHAAGARDVDRCTSSKKLKTRRN